LEESGALPGNQNPYRPPEEFFLECPKSREGQIINALGLEKPMFEAADP